MSTKLPITLSHIPSEASAPLAMIDILNFKQLLKKDCVSGELT